MIYEVVRELNAMFTGADDPPLETVIERDELVGSVGAELVEPLFEVLHRGQHLHGAA